MSEIPTAIEEVRRLNKENAELKKERDELKESNKKLETGVKARFIKMVDLEKENAELKADVETLADGIAAQCELDTEKGKILSHIANTWDWTMQCEQPRYVIDQLRVDYGVSGYKDIELMVFMECHKRDMKDKEQGE